MFFKNNNLENHHRSRIGDLFAALSKYVKWVMLLVIMVLLCFALFIGYYMWRASAYDLDNIKKSAACTQVMASDGTSLGSPYRRGGLVLSREEIPDQLVQALVAREDEEFFDHRGIDFSAMVRSFLRNVKARSFKQGGSTLTMQLVRNAFELREKTIDRKILEMFLAQRVEKAYTKDQILQAYLNRVYFGSGAYGVGDAAQVYFGKKVKELTLGECAMLVGILRGPSLFNPFNNVEIAKKERNDTLMRMKLAELITDDVYNEAIKEELKINAGELKKQTSYPLSWVEREMKEQAEQDSSFEIGQDTGIYVETSFDLGLQRFMERSIEESLIQSEGTKEWLLPNRSENLDQCAQVIALVVIPSTGDVLGYVAGRDSMNGKNLWEDMPRQLGGLFNPLVNLAASEESKFVVRNSPTQTLINVGDDSVKKFAESVGLGNDFPDGDDLALGKFSRPLFSMVPILLAFQNNGYAPHIHAINQGLSPANSILYQVPHYKLDLKDALLPLNSTRIVYKLPPFTYNEFKKYTKLSVSLPENEGFFVAYLHAKLAVFLWLGQVKPTTQAYESSKFKKLLRTKAETLAFDMLAFKLDYIKEMPEVTKVNDEAEMEKPASSSKTKRSTTKSSTKKKR